MDKSDDKFVSEAKALFDDSVDGLDAATLATVRPVRG